jgi:hypothetical protein
MSFRDFGNFASKHAIDEFKISNRQQDPKAPPNQPNRQIMMAGERIRDGDVLGNIAAGWQQNRI